MTCVQSQLPPKEKFCQEPGRGVPQLFLRRGAMKGDVYCSKGVVSSVVPDKLEDVLLRKNDPPIHI